MCEIKVKKNKCLSHLTVKSNCKQAEKIRFQYFVHHEYDAMFQRQIGRIFSRLSRRIGTWSKSEFMYTTNTCTTEPGYRRITCATTSSVKRHVMINNSLSFLCYFYSRFSFPLFSWYGYIYNHTHTTWHCIKLFVLTFTSLGFPIWFSILCHLVDCFRLCESCLKLKL